MRHGTRSASDSFQIHTKKASHKTKWKEKDRNNSENNNSFTVVFQLRFHQLHVLNSQARCSFPELSAIDYPLLKILQNFVNRLALVLEFHFPRDAGNLESRGIEGLPEWCQHRFLLP